MAAEVDLNAKLTKLNNDINQLTGKRELLLTQLKEEFGLDSVEAATAEIKSLQAEYQQIRQERDAAYAAFMEKHGDAIAAI